MSGKFHIFRPIGGGYIVAEPTIRKIAKLIEAFAAIAVIAHALVGRLKRIAGEVGLAG
jgi:hypothetical protein